MLKREQEFLVEVERGPNWVFVKLRFANNQDQRSETASEKPENVAPDRSLREEEFSEGQPQIADQLWNILVRHFTYRMVVELDTFEELPAGMMGQLILLRERILKRGGMLRVCGMSETLAAMFANVHTKGQIPNFLTRVDAVRGKRTGQRPSPLFVKSQKTKKRTNEKTKMG